VLVIEDDVAMRTFFRTALGGAGYRVEIAASAADGLQHASTRSPDLVILDLGLPDGDGLDVARHLRAWSAVPIIVVTARGREQDKISALDAGADDYVTKPFAVGELFARMRAALRRSAQMFEAATRTVFDVRGLVVDLERRRVTVEGREVRLTPLEFKLLATLARHAGRVLTHAQLLREVWGPAHTGQHHYLRVYMGQLRHKIERDPSRPRYLLTEPGVGYRLSDL
jgi:two-component system KDP operon response regulator KdpE